MDSTDTSESAFPSALALCKEFGPLVVAVSGETDIITDGNVKVSVRNGQVRFVSCCFLLFRSDGPPFSWQNSFLLLRRSVSPSFGSSPWYPLAHPFTPFMAGVCLKERKAPASCDSPALCARVFRRQPLHMPICPTSHVPFPARTEQCWRSQNLTGNADQDHSCWMLSECDVCVVLQCGRAPRWRDCGESSFQQKRYRSPWWIGRQGSGPEDCAQCMQETSYPGFKVLASKF